MNKDEALRLLREQIRQERAILGAGAGTGLSATPADTGGAHLTTT